MNIGLVFSMIFAIIIIAFVLAFGSEQIMKFFGLSKATSIKKALSELEVAVSRVYNLAEGSVYEHSLNIPSNTKFCFVDPANPEERTYPDFSRNWKPDDIIITTIKEKSYNVWWESGNSKGGETIKYLKPEENFCVRGSRKIFLVNNGLSVGVTD